MLQEGLWMIQSIPINTCGKGCKNLQFLVIRIFDYVLNVTVMKNLIKRLRPEEVVDAIFVWED